MDGYGYMNMCESPMKSFGSPMKGVSNERGFQWKEFPMKGVSNERGLQWKGFPMKWVSNERGFQWKGFPMKGVSNERGLQWKGFPMKGVSNEGEFPIKLHKDDFSQTQKNVSFPFISYILF